MIPILWYIHIMTACAAAYRATVVPVSLSGANLKKITFLSTFHKFSINHQKTMLLWKSSPQFLLLFHRHLQQLTMLCTLFDCSVFHYVKVKLILPTDTFITLFAIIAILQVFLPVDSSICVVI